MFYRIEVIIYHKSDELQLNNVNWKQYKVISFRCIVQQKQRFTILQVSGQIFYRNLQVMIAAGMLYE